MQYDYTPLKDIVTRQDIASYDEEIRTINARQKGGHVSDTATMVIIGVVFGLAVLAVWNMASGDTGGPGAIIRLGVVAVLIVAGIAYLSYAARKEKVCEIRLRKFCAHNELGYQAYDKSVIRSGMIFNVGTHHGRFSIISSNTGQLFEIANHTYTSKVDTEKTIQHGYIAIALDRHLPHMVLDSHKNNRQILGISVSNLPMSFKKDQKLPLEGDFNRHFTLYAPKEYERDALYVFTPDLMQLFITESGAFDAEIVDDTLYIYSDKLFNLHDEATLRRLMQIVETVGGKTTGRTSYYADERVGDRTLNIVAEPGRRLKKRGRVVLVVLIVLAVLSLYWLLLSLQG